jgi:hypothetical protein
MIEEPGHCHTLLFTTRQDILPIRGYMPSTFTFHNMIKVYESQAAFQMPQSHAFAPHVSLCIWVDHLIC